MSISPANLPKIYEALTIDSRGEIFTLEVHSDVGGKIVRAVAMSSTDGIPPRQPSSLTPARRFRSRSARKRSAACSA